MIAGPASLAKRRRSGADPAHGGSAGRARGRRNAEHHATIAAWKQHTGEEGLENDADETNPMVFTREILPGLQGVPLREMSEATGLTQGYCSFVRRGLKVPHKRHWNALKRLGMTNS